MPMHRISGFAWVLVAAALTFQSAHGFGPSRRHTARTLPQRMSTAEHDHVDASDPLANDSDELSAEALESLAQTMGGGAKELTVDDLAGFDGFSGFSRAIDGVSLEDVSREILASESVSSLSEEEKSVYDAAIKAEFERVVLELKSVGEELKQQSEESMLASQALSSKAAAEALSEAQKEVAEYEKTASVLVERVKAESANVEREVTNLRALQTQMESDPLLKLSNFRNQALPKKALLVGALLFFVRGGADGMSAITSGDPGLYVEPALAQLGVSIASLAAYLFL